MGRSISEQNQQVVPRPLTSPPAGRPTTLCVAPGPGYLWNGPRKSAAVVPITANANDTAQGSKPLEGRLCLLFTLSLSSPKL